MIGDILVTRECGDVDGVDLRYAFWRVIGINGGGSMSVVRLETVNVMKVFVLERYPSQQYTSHLEWIQRPSNIETRIKGTYYGGTRRICSKHCDFVSGDKCKFSVVELVNKDHMNSIQKQAWTKTAEHEPHSFVCDF